MSCNECVYYDYRCMICDQGCCEEHINKLVVFEDKGYLFYCLKDRCKIKFYKALKAAAKLVLKEA
jgi:hypothetical protein